MVFMKYKQQNQAMNSNPLTERQSQPRMPDKLEDIYTDESRQFVNEERARKRLYSQIISQSNKRMEEKRSLQKKLNREQNQQIDLFWRNEEQRLREMERRRRHQIDEARKVNQSSFQDQLHRSAVIEPYYKQRNDRDDVEVFARKEQDRREEQRRFYKEGMEMDLARRQKQMFEHAIDSNIDLKKEAEMREQDYRRAEYYENWRKKHFQEHHPGVVQQLKDINQRKKQEQKQLQDLVAIKGGQELNQRVAAQRVAEIERQQAQREQFVNSLKKQVDDNTYKAAIDRYLQLNHERTQIQQVNETAAIRDAEQAQRRRKHHEEYRRALKGQMKTRSLLPQPYPVEQAGVGSPAHIGHIVHEDRLRQLKWIERNLVQEVNQI